MSSTKLDTMKLDTKNTPALKDLLIKDIVLYENLYFIGIITQTPIN